MVISRFHEHGFLPAANLIRDGWSILSCLFLTRPSSILFSIVVHVILFRLFEFVDQNFSKLFSILLFSFQLAAFNSSGTIITKIISSFVDTVRYTNVFIVCGLFSRVWSERKGEGKVLTNSEREVCLVLSPTRQKNWRQTDVTDTVFIHLFFYLRSVEMTEWLKKLSLLWFSVDDG